MSAPSDNRLPKGAADVAAAKHAARARARAARSAIEALAASAAVESAAELLLSLPELEQARVILAYGASPEELDPLPAVIALRGRGVTIAYPRVESPGVLGLHAAEEGCALERGMFGILEPAAGWPRIEPEVVDTVIVPGVAFDEKCWRLGYGGGYYDRLLPLLREDCARIGFGFDEQILETIPAEEHDVILDIVVTPTRILRAEG